MTTADAVVHVSDGLVADGLDYARRVEERLQHAGLTTARHDLTDLHATVPAAELHVLTGGSTSVSSDVRWMQRALAVTRALVTDAQRGGPTVVGICLGSQLVAEALQPGSLVSASHIEVGLVLVRPPDAGTPEISVPAFHYEQIAPSFAATPGVTVEWGNEHSAIQSFRVGDRVFGHQFHPELTPEDLHSLIDFNAETIGRYGGDVGLAHESVERNSAALPAGLFSDLVVHAGRGHAPG